MFVVPRPDHASATAKAPAAAPSETIAFLCPNGHKLTGPSSLQGKAGQCPHCGSKFRIPIYDEPQPEAGAAAEEDDIPVGEMVEQHDTTDDVEDVEVVDEEAADEDGDVVDDVELDESDLTPPPPPPDGLHPLGQVCLRLWRQGHGGVEVGYGDGETLAADYFSPELSQLDYGVFATRHDDGTYTIVAVPWQSVFKLAFRKVAELPPRMFE
jgi:hypothetical protein